MTATPGVIRLATNARRPLFETAFDAVWDPILVVDASAAHVPIVLANAAARREFERDGAAPLLEGSVYSVLAPAAASLVHAVLEGSSSTVAQARDGVVWRFVAGDRAVPTEFQCLDAGPNQRLVMLTLRDPGLAGRGTVSAQPTPTMVSPPEPMPEPSDPWLHQVLALANAHVWRWDAAADTLSFAVDAARDAALPVLFPTRERLLARVHPKDRGRLDEFFRNAFADAALLRTEYRLRLGDGRYRAFVLTARPLRRPSGEPVGLVAVAQDVTERFAAEARVRESESLLRLATAHMADTLVLLGTDLRIRFINAGIAGLSPAQLVGRDVGVILPEHDRTSVSERLRRLLRSGEAVTVELERHDLGRPVRHLELQARRLKGAGTGIGISLTLRDATERKRLEHEILEAGSRERHAIGRDLHDGLGQELTGVALMLRSLATRLARQTPDLVGYVDEVVALVNQGIETARGLTRGLLPVHAQNGGLPYALRELVARGRHQFGFDIDLRVEIWPELTLEEAAASHLYRIAQEALTNAARHASPTRVEILLLVTGGNYLLKISDDGVGIAPAKAIGDGGLGLKIMRYRAGMIGAKLNITSALPHGTAIQVTGVQPAPPITL